MRPVPNGHHQPAPRADRLFSGLQAVRWGSPVSLRDCRPSPTSAAGSTTVDDRPARRHIATPSISIHSVTSIEPLTKSTLASGERPVYACSSPAAKDTLPPRTPTQPSSLG